MGLGSINTYTQPIKKVEKSVYIATIFLLKKIRTKEQNIVRLLLYPARSKGSRRQRIGYDQLRRVAKHGFVGYT